MPTPSFNSLPTSTQDAQKQVKSITSSSSCLALQLWYSLGLLNNSLPFEAILDLFCSFYEFHLLQVVPDIVFPSGLGSSYWSSCEWFSFVYFLYNTSFRHSIYVSKPTQSLGFNIIYYVPMFYELIQFYVCFDSPVTIISPSHQYYYYWFSALVPV